MKFIFSAALAFCLVATAGGVNSLEEEFTCPIDGKHWTQRVESSANPRGLRLDLRQLGDVVDPPTLPLCPDCHFPHFSDRLAEQANDPTKADAFKRLRAFVLGADFQMLSAKYPAYFCLALVQEHLGAPELNIALSYQRASWQAEDREAVCRVLLEKAHTHFLAALEGMKPDDRRAGDVGLLCGEVERRLGKWDEAERRFHGLQHEGAFADPRKLEIVGMQLKLLALRDSHPRPMDQRIEMAKAQETPKARKIANSDEKPKAPETSQPDVTPEARMKGPMLGDPLELPTDPGKLGLELEFAVPAAASAGKARSKGTPAAN